MIRRRLTACALLSLGSALGAAQANWFEDVTVAAGVNDQDNSFGVSWGDVNGDGYPDIYLSNHFHVPTLYLNQGDGTFVDVQSAHDIAMGHVDVHACSWADYDNDGDQDLIKAVGGFTPGGGIPDTPYFDNVDGTLLVGDPQGTGLNYSYSSRSPVWLDENSDGLLDLLMVSRPRVAGFYTALLRQVSPGMFENVTAASGLDGNLAASGYLLLGPNAPQRPDIMLNRGRYYQHDGSQWQDTTAAVFGGLGALSDAAQGDVNGDELLDLYVVREGSRSEIFSDANNIGLAYKSTSGVLGAIDFGGGGILEVIRSLHISINAFRLGASESRITLANVDDPVVLDPLDPDVQGEPSITLESALRVWVWYTAADAKWHFRVGSTTSPLVEMGVRAQDAISDLTFAGIDATDSPPLNKVYMNNGDGTYTLDTTSALRLGPTRSAIMADLDNDMDMDVYVVNRNAVRNLPNQLFENLGDGSFVEVANAGGAAGPLEGNGDSVAFADYDRDGFLDLFVTNGRSDLIMPAYPGPHSLFRNTGNTNNWLQIDLEGTASNREGIGAVVEVTTGAVTQTRMQDGGMHGFAQNFRRLHFGLANFELVDKVTVRWPSGTVQEVRRVPINQVIRVVEAESELLPGVPAGVSGGADGVYLWKETFDGPYHVRTIDNAGGSATTVRLISTLPVADISQSSTMAPADLATHDYGFDLVTNAAAGTDTVDFQLSPGAAGLYTVETDAEINPRLVTLGAGNGRPTPAGWLVDTAALGLFPPVRPGVDLGLFVGRTQPGQLRLRWNGDGIIHQGTVELYAREPWLVGIAPAGLEGRDTFFAGVTYGAATGGVRYAWDGVNVAVRHPTPLGILYAQDGLFQRHVVNFDDADGALGEPNAYRLPQPSAFGKPDYDLSVEGRLFLWQVGANRWLLRGTAGTAVAHYRGRIVSDKEPLSVTARNLEANDSVDTTDPLVVQFEFRAGPRFWDGLDINYPPDTRLRVYVDQSNIDTVDSLRIGAQKWPVSRLPVQLNAGTEHIEPPARVRATGQLTSFGPGDDGAMRAGANWPTPRFEAQPDGTVYDNLTGLIWLANANCFGQQDWAGAVAAAAGLDSGQCGLSDGSRVGDWRLANSKELLSLIDYGRTQPALPAAHPFVGVQNEFYWSSTTTRDNAGRAWGVQVAGGNLERRRKDASQHPVTGKPHFMWPVKGP